MTTVSPRLVVRASGKGLRETILTISTQFHATRKWYGAHFKDVDMNVKATKVTFGDDSDDE
eukprot:4010426-Pyramimonas_sp.AAC.1